MVTPKQVSDGRPETLCCSCAPLTMSGSCVSLCLATGYNRDALKRLAPSAGPRSHVPFGHTYSTFFCTKKAVLRPKYCQVSAGVAVAA